MRSIAPSKLRQDLEENGVVFPIDVISPSEASALLNDYDRIAARMHDWTSTPQLI